MEVAAADRTVCERCIILLGTLTPTWPITLEDAAAVWRLLKPDVVPPYKLDVYHVYSELRVGVRRDGEVVFERALQPAR